MAADGPDVQLAVKSGSHERDAAPDRRDPLQPTDRVLGRVVACSGARATISATLESGGASPDAWAIGKMISINLGATRVVGLVYEMRAVKPVWEDNSENAVHVEVELLGEVVEGARDKAIFRNGISIYPPIGAAAHRIRAGDLAVIHDLGARAGVAIGALTQDSSIPATISIDAMLSRHFALVGTTGVGKSSAVALLLRKAIQARPKLRVLVLDPHNEYAHAFPDAALTIDAAGLDLPFWMFQFEEFSDVVFRGRPALDDENDILREVIAMARGRYRMPANQDISRDLNATVLKRPLDPGAPRRGADGAPIPADLPAPYRIVDALAAIDELVGLHEARFPRASLRSLKVRIEGLYADPRYQFMFARANMIESMAPVVGHIFRIPQYGRPITVFQLAGLPSEVVNAVASVLARIAFNLAMGSQGGYEILLLCEEAHRYVPSDHALGFAPTRQAIARIAKEGRKYGAYLGVVTQRPGELDPTILSQCSTIFAMRLANDRDQQIIRAAIADASASTINFLSSIGNREAIAFGEGVATAMRMRFATLPPAELPAMAGSTPEGGPRREPGLEELVSRLRGS